MTQLAFWLVIGGHVFTALPSYTSNRHAQEGCQSRRLGRRCMRRVYSFSDSQCRLPCLNFHGLSGTAVSRPIVSISRVAFLNCLVSVVFFVIFYGNSVLHRQLLLSLSFFFFASHSLLSAKSETKATASILRKRRRPKHARKVVKIYQRIT